MREALAIHRSLTLACERHVLNVERPLLSLSSLQHRGEKAVGPMLRWECAEESVGAEKLFGRFPVPQVPRQCFAPGNCEPFRRRSVHLGDDLFVLLWLERTGRINYSAGVPGYSDGVPQHRYLAAMRSLQIFWF